MCLLAIRGGTKYRRNVVGLLHLASSNETFRLGPRCLLGRAPTCDVRVDDRRVSNEHAVIQYNRGGWELRDLNSRNGTYVGGRRVGSDWILLSKGMELAIGGRDLSFTLIDASAPAAAATNTTTSEIRTATRGLLLLPDDERPSVTIFERFDSRWIAESVSVQADLREVKDREVLIIEGVAWKLELPAPNTTTIDTSDVGPAIDTIGLRFAVSRDEEHVELTMLHHGREMKIASRTYHYLLLTLGRAWLADAVDSSEERGWVDREQLSRMLAVDLGKLNVDIHRARGQFARLGVLHAADLIVRRLDTGQLRLGVRHVEVVRLSQPGEEGAPSSNPSETP